MAVQAADLAKLLTYTAFFERRKWYVPQIFFFWHTPETDATPNLKANVTKQEHFLLPQRRLRDTFKQFLKGDKQRQRCSLALDVGKVAVCITGLRLKKASSLGWPETTI